jgi:hypothetical protein
MCILHCFRFKDSSLNVLGNFEALVDGKCAILGGTGEFAYAQGVFSFKKVLESDNGKTRVRELEIRVLCPNFASSLPVVYTLFVFGSLMHGAS